MRQLNIKLFVYLVSHLCKGHVMMHSVQPFIVKNGSQASNSRQYSLDTNRGKTIFPCKSYLSNL